MGNTSWLWPVNGKSFYNINDKNYLVQIRWSRNINKDYQKMSQEFFYAAIRYARK